MRENTGPSIMDWWKSELRKLSLRRLGETAFLVTFLLIWLPRAIPIQPIIAFLWPIYHWFGVDYNIPLEGSWRTHWLHPSLLRRGFRKGICGRLKGYRQDPNENTRDRNKRKDNYYEAHRSRPKISRLEGSNQDHGKGRETNRP